MFSEIFGPSFDAGKLKLQLKLAQNRIQILKTKKENLARDEKKHISELLRNKNEESARIRVETVIRDEYLIECYNILHVLCDLLINRTNLILNTSEIPIELKESIFTIIYSSQRMQIPELENVRNQLKYKYGKVLVEEVNCECSTHVNPKVVYKLSYLTPEPHIVFQYLDDIAKQYNVGWAGDPHFQQAQYLPSFSQPIYPGQYLQQPSVPPQAPPAIQQGFPNQAQFQQPYSPVPPQQVKIQPTSPNSGNSTPQFPQFPTIIVPQKYTPPTVSQQPLSFPSMPTASNQPPPSFPSIPTSHQPPPSFPSMPTGNHQPSFPQPPVQGYPSQPPSFPQPPPSLPLINEDDLNTNFKSQNNSNTGSMDFDELTLRFEALKKQNEF